MVALLLKASAEEGLEVRTNTRITAIEKQSAGYTVQLASGSALSADLVVHGASRVPDIEGLNLAAAGVESAPKGIRVNTKMQTTAPHIFAVGDCAATVALARVADFEAHVAARNIMAFRTKAAAMEADYTAVPFVLFSYPQYGMVGQTEDALKQQGIAYRKSTAAGVQWPTYRRVGMAHAGYKILVGENDTILGAHVISDSPAGLINIFKQAMIAGTPVAELYWNHIMTPYPSRESDIIYMLKPLLP